VNSNVRAGSSPAPSTLKPLIYKGFFVFRLFQKMKKIVLNIANLPTNLPVSITINLEMDLFSKVNIFKTKLDGKPCIIPGKGWYLYYYFRHPQTGKMTKFMDTCKINRFQTVKERTQAAEAWQNAITILLNNGFNPFDAKGIKPAPFEQKIYSVREALEYAYNNKLGTWKESTADDYRTRKNVFLEWCNLNKIDTIDIRDLGEIHIIAFMNNLIAPEKLGGRAVGKTSQDNYKRCLSGLFAKLVRDKLVPKNLFLDIETKKASPIKNTPFTGYEVKRIKDYLLENDKQLYHFIQFVIFSFLRPIEIVRLEVQNFNLRENYFKVETKTERKATVKIIKPIHDYLTAININSLPSKAHLFTNNDEIEIWDAKEKTKVDHFGHRFGKVKEALNFGTEYGIYSFRHTAALDLYYSFLKQGSNEREAILKLMPITRHTSENALRNYLRDVGGMLPKDYGSDYTLDF
jgi:integrase